MRRIFGITVRVAVESPGNTVSTEEVLTSLRRWLDEWSDGRRLFSVELLLDGARRVVETAVDQVARDAVRKLLGDPPLTSDSDYWAKQQEASAALIAETRVNALDSDSTADVFDFPTVKPCGPYRVICTQSRAEGAPEGYALATRKTFDTFKEAERYADGINSSRAPKILVEVERGSY